MTTHVTDPIYNAYLAALLAGDRAGCTAIVQELNNADIPLKDLYLNLFQRSLYRTGELWEHHKVSVSVEHLATAITERLLTLVEPKIFSGQYRDQSVIVACVADEYHQLGARMVADLFELHGWRGYFLGANTPVQDLLTMIEQKNPALIALSLSIYSNLPALIKALEAVRAKYPDLPILVGGQAFRWGGTDLLKQYSNVTYIASIDQLEQEMEKYRGR
jgi:methanogenic corrinoid protein MtbC1